MAVIGSALWSYVILAALMALTGFSVVLLTYSVDKNRRMTAAALTEVISYLREVEEKQDKSRRMTAVALTEVISYIREVEEKQEMILELLEHLQGDLEHLQEHLQGDLEHLQEHLQGDMEHLQGDMEQRCTHTPAGNSKDIAGFDRKYVRFATKWTKKALLWFFPFASTAIDIVHDVIQLMV